MFAHGIVSSLRGLYQWKYPSVNSDPVITRPTYQFDHHTFWFKDRALADKPTLQRLLYDPVWEPSSVFETCVNNTLSCEGIATVMIITNNAKFLLVKNLVAKLLDLSIQVIGIIPTFGANISPMKNESQGLWFKIGFKESEAFDIFVADHLSNTLVSSVLYVVDDQCVDVPLAARQMSAHCTAFAHVSSYLSSLVINKPQITLVTTAVPPSSNSSNLLSSVLVGLSRTVRLEYSAVFNTVLHLEESVSSDPSFVETLLSACFNFELGLLEPEIKILSEHKCEVPRLIPSKVTLPSTLYEIEPQATYIVTGGVRGAGLEMARMLARVGAKRLVLVCRTVPKQGTLTEKDVEKLRGRGAVVDVVACNIGDLSKVEELITFACGRKDLPLRGIVHAAGVLSETTVADSEYQDFYQHILPKMGAASLNAVVESRKLSLDFFVMFSSISALIGNRLLGPYGAANCILNSVAQRRLDRGEPASSFYWGNMRGGSMFNPEYETANRKIGFNSIPHKYVTQLYGFLLNYSSAQLTIADIDWKKAVVLLRAMRPLPFYDHVLPKKTAAHADLKPHSIKHQLSSVNFADTVGPMERSQTPENISKIVSSVVTDVMEMPHLDTSRPLMEAGMDSMMAVEIGDKLTSSFSSMNFSPTVLFDYPSVDALSDYISSSLIPKSESFTDASTVLRAAASFSSSSRIAVIGMACRFPGGANSPEELWELMCCGCDVLTEVPPTRWDHSAFYGPTATVEDRYRICTARGGFLDIDVRQFDPEFFGITRREAPHVDPLHRTLLEVSWNCLEAAGYGHQKRLALIAPSCGVYVGISNSDYTLIQATSCNPTVIDQFGGIGSSNSSAAGRLAYHFGLHGPAFAIDAACASSLVAIHEAALAIRTSTIRAALAGGVNLMLAPQPYINLSLAKMLSPDGCCYTFDSRASGYARGEGCGMVLLRAYESARHEGDRILGLILGSSASHDGRSASLTAPNGIAQESMIREALYSANVQPDDIEYVELHGTGTKLGDPIEAESLDRIFNSERRREKRLMVGSVKSQIGHTEAAAGVAGLIRVLLQFEHKAIPPHPTFQKLNPLIKDDILEVVRKKKEWGGSNRCAGISSFGFTGTIAHLVVAAPDSKFADRKKSREARPEEEDVETIIPISAKNKIAIKRYVHSLRKYLDSHRGVSLRDMAFTLASGRGEFMHRLACVAPSLAAFKEQLENLDRGLSVTGVHFGSALYGKPVFVFTGQGSQYVNMGRQLFETQPAFRHALEQCATVLDNILEVPLLSVLYPENQETYLIDQTGYTQPCLFSVEYALAKMWLSWGIWPAAVMGHSVGEFVAAVIAGVMTLEDGLKLIACRGRLMQSLPSGGGMMAVKASRSVVMAAIKENQLDLYVAAHNGPESVVISGKLDEIRRAMELLSMMKIKWKQLEVSHAFHSPLLNPILNELEACSATIVYHEPKIPIISNSTGKFVEQEKFFNAKYWRDHARMPVDFMSSVQALRSRKLSNVILEIGPHPIMLGMMKAIPSEIKEVYVPSMRFEHDEYSMINNAKALLWCNGIDVGLDNDYFKAEMVDLPTYQFETTPYWLDIDANQFADMVSINKTYNMVSDAREKATLSPRSRSQSIVSPRSRSQSFALPISSEDEDEDEEKVSVEHRMMALLHTALQDDSFDSTVNLVELGVDSLLSMEIVETINAQFNTDISPAFLLECDSIRSLIVYVQEHALVIDDNCEKMAVTQQNRIVIEPCRPQDKHILSFQEESLVIEHSLNPTSSRYHIALGAFMRGTFNVTKFKAAVRKTIERHEILRTKYEITPEGPRAVLIPLDQLEVNLPMHQAPCQSQIEVEYWTQKIVNEIVAVPFVLNGNSSLMQVHLLMINHLEVLVLVVFHHIVTDGLANMVVLGDIGSYYAGEMLPTPSLNYRDYAVWQRRELDPNTLAEKMKYWHTHLGINPAPINLSPDILRHMAKSSVGESYQFSIPFEAVDNISMYALSAGVSKFVTLLSVFYVLLHRYTEDEQILVGTPVANRPCLEMNCVPGFFVNTTVSKCTFSDTTTFNKLLLQVREDVGNFLQHCDVPFSELVKALCHNRDGARSPLVQVMFGVYDNNLNGSSVLKLLENRCNVKVAPLSNIHRDSMFEIELFIRMEEDGVWTGQFHYDSSLYHAPTIHAMAECYCWLLKTLPGVDTLPVPQIPLCDPDTPPMENIFGPSYGFMEEDCPRSTLNLLHEFFEKNVDERPNTTALILGNRKMTYAELNNRANFTARKLKEAGAKTGCLVGVCTERVMEMIIGFVAVLKAGCAYAPLDPNYPTGRVVEIVEQGDIHVVLCTPKAMEAVKMAQRVLADREEEEMEYIIELVECDARGEVPPTPPPVLETGPTRDNLAYCMFTSGSTGHPKGVPITHGRICEFLVKYERIFDLRPGEAILQYSAYTFDMGVMDLWGCFNGGATYVMCSKEELLGSMVSLINKHKVTVFNGTPTLLNLMEPEQVPSIRSLTLCGEPCPYELMKKWAGNGRKFYNTYGVTETTVYSHAALLHPDDAYPCNIGYPLPRVDQHIVDRHLNKVPHGCPGEMLIAGEQCFDGYLKLPDLTKKLVIKDPFLNNNYYAYRTGDKVRYLPDGSVQFIGRVDFQVKLRGLRIELGEIDNVIRTHPSVKSCVTILRSADEGREPYLASYVILKDSLTPTFPKEEVGPTILTHSRNYLTEYMVPAALVLLDDYPRNPSGKTDRRALPMPVVLGGDSGSFADDGPKHTYTHENCSVMEKKIVAVFATLLNMPMERVSVDGDFFTIGGNSLLAVRAISVLREHCPSLSVTDIFSHHSAKSLAEKISVLNQEGAAEERPPQDLKAETPDCVSTAAPFSPFTFGLIQFLCILYMLGVTGAPLLGQYFLFNKLHDSFSRTAWVFLPVLMLMYIIALALLLVFHKWLVVGRLKPGRYRVGTFYFIRWWFVYRLSTMTVFEFALSWLKDSPLLNLLLRGLGARVSLSARLDTVKLMDYDLLHVGAGTALEHDVVVCGHVVEDGWLVLRPVVIGNHVHVGPHSVIHPGARLENGVHLGALSLAPFAAVLPKHSIWEGNPSRQVGTHPCSPPSTAYSHNGIFALLSFLPLLVCLGCSAGYVALPVLYFLFIREYIDSTLLSSVVGGLGAVPVLVVSTIFITVFFKRLILWKVREGEKQVSVLFRLRVWTVNRLLQSPLLTFLLLPVSTTAVVPWFYRLLGMSIGKGASMAVCPGLQADLNLISLGRFAFLGGHVHISCTQYYRQTPEGPLMVRRKRVSCGAVATLTEHNVLLRGATLEDYVTVASLSLLPQNVHIPTLCTVMGNPCHTTLLPRDTVVDNSSRSSCGQLLQPKNHTMLVNLGYMFAMLLVCALLFGLVGCVVYGVNELLEDGLDLSETTASSVLFLALPLMVFMAGVVMMLVSALLKRVLLGKRFYTGNHPLWGPHHLVWNIIRSVTIIHAALVSELFRGTVFIAWTLRLFGARVGKHVYIDTNGFIETDPLTLGDRCCLGRETWVLAHVVDHGQLQHQPIVLHPRTTLGHMVHLQPGVVVAPHTALESLSMALKGEALEGGLWHGNTVRKASSPNCIAPVLPPTREKMWQCENRQLISLDSVCV